LALGVALLAPLAIAAPPAVEAQERRVLTLQEALELAARHNPDYRQAQNTMTLSGPASRAALGAFLPNLNLSAGTGLSANRRLVAEDFFGNPIDNPQSEWQTSSSSSQNLSAGLTLFEGMGRYHDLSAERATADSRAMAAEGQLLITLAGVERQFYLTLQQADLLEVAQRLLETRQLDLRMTQRRYELAGTTSRVDVLAAELAVRQQERAIQQAQAEFEKALLTLRTTIGARDLVDFTVATGTPDAFDPRGLDVGGLVSRTLVSNPRILRQEAEVSASAARARAARGGRWPSVSMNFGFYQSTNALESAALFDPFPQDSRYGSTSLSVSIPLFSRFQTANAIAQADVGRRNSEETLRQTRMQVEEEVSARIIDLRGAYEGVRLAQQSWEIAQERLRLGRELYQMGSRTFVELQQDIEAAVNAEREAINQRYTFIQARVNLEETVGAPVGPTGGGGAGERPGPSEDGALHDHTGSEG
jgi:outer membrane protein